MKTAFRGFLASIVIVAAAIYILVNHSVTNIVLTCPGEWKSQYGGPGRATTAHVVIELFRPWIVWANSDGNAWFETSSLVDYASDVKRFGHSELPAYAFLNDDLSMRGGYQSSTGELTYRVRGGTQTFVGQCE